MQSTSARLPNEAPYSSKSGLLDGASQDRYIGRLKVLYVLKRSFGSFADCKAFYFFGHRSPGLTEVWVGILNAHISHLLSVFILYRMSRSIWNRTSEEERTRFAFLAALLHIISPAGIFLSAPYAESPFALLNFLGYYFCLKAYEYQSKGGKTKKQLSTLAAGLLFAVATMFRSNGILSGFVFAYDAILITWRMLYSEDHLSHLKDFPVVIASGTMVALGSLIPQSLAFRDYCSKSVEEPRPWCNHWVPSIYAWVQSHYW